MTEDGFPKFQTEKFYYYFNVRQYPEGGFWIEMEPVEEDLKPLTKGFLGFDLPESITLERANEIAHFMNDSLKKVTYTWLPS
jgi:hypothetical protein